MQKVSKIVLYVLVAISVVLAVLFFTGGSVTDATGAETDEPIFTGLNLGWSLVMFVIAIILTLLFSIYQIITNPAALKGALISLVVGAVLVGVAYFLASDVPIPDGKEATTATLKWVGTGIIATYILGGLAILAIIVSEIYRAFN